jgi:hypothetical protein
MNRRTSILISTAVAVLAAASTPRPAESPSPSASPAQAGYRVYIDPSTGSITSQPTQWGPVVVDPAMKNALDTSSDGLREEQSPVPGGGVMVHLDGRFQNVEMGAVGPDGKLVTECVSGLPENGDHETAGGTQHEGE